ncbi:MAG: GNAT family N-acetyltransferase [Clostridia bacterium]|nr:GNAT family N-acetyltransferase [Clostridia bacterium]
MKSLVYDGLTYSVSCPYPDDISAHRDLFEDIFSHPEYFDFFTSLSKNDSYLISVKDEGGKLAGMAFLLPCVLKNKEDSAMGYYMYSVCVDKSFRGRGIFKMICEFAEETAKSLSGKFIALIPADTLLFETYTRFGYSLVLPGRAPVGADYDTHELTDAQELLSHDIEASMHAPTFILPLVIQPFCRKDADKYADHPIFDKGLMKRLDNASDTSALFSLLPFADNFPE